MIGSPQRRRTISALTLAASLTFATAAVAQPPAAGARVERLRSAEAALRKDNKRLRLRDNIERMIADWHALEDSADPAERAAALEGQARGWALMAHWSGTASDRAAAARAQAKVDAPAARKSEARAETATRSSRDKAPSAAMLAKIDLETSELGVELMLPQGEALRAQRELLPARRGQGARVYFDVSPLVAAPEALVTMPVDHPAVLRLRVGQFNARTVRFVFDLPAGQSAPEVMEFAAGETPRLRIGRRGVGEGAAADDPLAALLEIQRAIDGVAPGETAAITPEAKRALEAMVADIRQDVAPDDSAGAPEVEVSIAADAPSTAEAVAVVAAPAVEDKPRSRGPVAPSRGSLVRIRRVVVDAGHGGRDGGATGKRGTKEKDVNLAIARQLAKVLEQKLGVEVVLTRNKDVYVSLGKRVEIANRANADLFISVHSNAHRNRKYHGIETYYLNTTSNRYANRLAARENQEQWDDQHLDAGDPGEASSEDESSALPGGALGRDLRLLLADLAMRSATDDSRRLAGFVQSNLVATARRREPSAHDLGVKHALFFVLLGARMPSILVESGFLSHAGEERRLADPGYQRHLAEAIAAGVARFVDERNQIASRL